MRLTVTTETGSLHVLQVEPDTLVSDLCVVIEVEVGWDNLWDMKLIIWDDMWARGMELARGFPSLQHTQSRIYMRSPSLGSATCPDHLFSPLLTLSM